MPPVLLNDAKPDAEVIKNLLLKYNDKLSNHRCGRCNFKAKRSSGNALLAMNGKH